MKIAYFTGISPRITSAFIIGEKKITTFNHPIKKYLVEVFRWSLISESLKIYLNNRSHPGVRALTLLRKSRFRAKRAQCVDLASEFSKSVWASVECAGQTSLIRGPADLNDLKDLLLTAWRYHSTPRDVASMPHQRLITPDASSKCRVECRSIHAERISAAALYSLQPGKQTSVLSVQSARAILLLW